MTGDPHTPDGVALVLCEGSYGSGYGKTAHGLVRFTRRYRVRAVIDSTLAGRDAGTVLDGRPRGIPIVADLSEGLSLPGEAVTHLVVGVATIGGRLPEVLRPALHEALSRGIHVDSGLHQFLGEDPEFAACARRTGAVIRDVRRPPPREALHFATGRLEEVRAARIAILGTDCAVGKRTTAWILVEALERMGVSAELIGTGQTAWMQGVRHGLVLDSLVNDFVTGEIEHAVRSAWRDRAPRVIVIEGQGSLIHPAYPGGFEILGGARPTGGVIQHAPGRRWLEGFDGVPVAHPKRHMEVVRLIADTPTLAVTISRENLAPGDLPGILETMERETGVPAFDPLDGGGAALAGRVIASLNEGSAP